MTKRYDELQVGDVINFHGANVKIINTKKDAETVSFEIEPADDEAIEILGEFYSHGWYSGVGYLKVWCKENEGA